MIDLTGQVAVVTGPGGNLGPVWTGALLRAGAAVAGVGPPGGAPAPDSPGARRFVPIPADVTDRTSLDAALDRCLDALGPPTVLVNNAGIDTPPSPGAGGRGFSDIPDGRSAETLDVNALGVMRVCQSFGAHMAQNGSGSIVNIGSLYGGTAPYHPLYDHIEPPFLKPPSYGMSKAAVASLTRYLATLWGPRGIRVNTLSPGGVLASQDPEFQKRFTERVPLGRMARADDLTGPLLFLASSMSSYLTGQEIIVDGGYVCW